MKLHSGPRSFAFGPDAFNDWGWGLKISATSEAMIGAGMRTPFGRFDAWALTALTAIACGLHWNAFKLWWLYDDPYILRVSLSTRLLSLFTDPAVYQQLSLVSFTPLLPASFRLDHLLFGLEPAGFILHQLLLLALTACLLYLLLRCWNQMIALWAAALFLASGPAAAASHLLMMRHYLEGGILALISLLLLSRRRSTPFSVWAAAGAYLAACLCKEVYAPLVIAVPFLAAGQLRTRLRWSLPFFLMAAGYAWWRLHMLRGAGLGSYAPNWINLLADPHFIFKGLQEIAAGLWSLVGADAAIRNGLLLGYAGAFTTLMLLLRQRRRLDQAITLGLFTAAALAVIAPVWGGCQAGLLITHRLFYHIALLVSIGGALLAAEAGRWWRARSGTAPGTGMKTACALVLWLPVVATAANQQRLVQSTLTHSWIAHSRENQFYFTEPSGQTLVTTTDGHHWEDLEWLRLRSDRGRPPAVCKKPYDLRSEPSRYFCYHTGQDQFLDCTDQFEADRRQWLAKIAWDGTFPVRIEIDRGSYAFRLDPGGQVGSYRLLFGAESNLYWDALQVPATFSGQLYAKPTAFHIRLARERPDGTWELSPEWLLNLAERQEIQWP